MFSLQDYLHDEQSDLDPLSSSESSPSSQYLDAQSELQSSSSSSYHSVNTQAHEILDEENDAENVLAFIAALDAVSETNETGWTHEKAYLALDAKRKREGHSIEPPIFDFFSHFDPALRKHLRHAYECRTRRGYTGDVQQGLSSDVATLQIEKLQALMDAIGVAIDTPAQESHGQLLRRKARADMERENRQLDEYDQKFDGTWKEVLNSTIAVGSVASNYLQKKFSD